MNEHHLKQRRAARITFWDKFLDQQVERYVLVSLSVVGDLPDSDEQFIYKTRKKGFGIMKQKWWDLPADVKAPIMKELEDKFDLLFEKLKVVNTKEYVEKHVKPVVVEKNVDDI